MCCRLEVSPLNRKLAAVQLAIGQFVFDAKAGQWRRSIPEEGCVVLAQFVNDRLHLSIDPTITAYAQHFGKRNTIGVYLEMAARYAQKVNGLVEQLSNVAGCSEAGVTRRVLAKYPDLPMDVSAVCAGFAEVIAGHEAHGAEDEAVAY